MVWDVAQAAPEVFDAVTKVSPVVADVVEGLRAGLPVMASSTPGEQGDFYRIRGHNRSVCIALAPDKAKADVVVIKGSEPLLPDFERYLDWMQFKQFGAWPRPMMEHFPLFEGKTPGTVSLDEARKESELALDVQSAHLRHYGELVRLPVPLLVLAVPEDTKARVITQLERRLSAPAFERVEAYLQRGIGMFVYHYPGPPIRVTAVGRPRFMCNRHTPLTEPMRFNRPDGRYSPIELSVKRAIAA